MPLTRRFRTRLVAGARLQRMSRWNSEGAMEAQDGFPPKQTSGPGTRPKPPGHRHPGVRRPAATLRTGTQRNSPSRPGSGPAHGGMAAINATGTSNTGSSASLDVRSFPDNVRSPAGTTTSADFCPVSPTSRRGPSARRQRQHNRHPGRSPRIRTTNFPLRRPRLRDDPVDGDGLHLLGQAHPDRPAFYAVRVPRCRVSPRASFPPRLTTTQLPPARS